MQLFSFLTTYVLLIALKVQSGEGETLFLSTCSACHFDGMNFILPEKNLKKATLALSGLNSLEALSYLITNGKNGMPAFGDRLNPMQIDQIANFLLQNNWKKQPFSFSNFKI
jgi:cytochrome c6